MVPAAVPLTRTISVLVVDDAPADVERTVALLRSGGLDPCWTRVDTAAAYRDALSTDVDVIITEYQLPGLTAREVVDTAAHYHIAAPVIVATRSDDDAAVATLLDRGAADYVFKARPRRLAAAVARAMELRTCRESVHRLVAESPAMIYSVTAPTFRTEYISENVRTQLGYSPQQFQHPVFWRERVHPEDLDAADAAVRGVIGNRLAREYRFRHADGSYRWMRDEATIVRDADGRPTHLLGHWLDISDRKRAELELRESEQRYRTLIETAPDGILLHSEGRILYANGAAARLLGAADAERLIGTRVLDLFAASDRERGAACIARIVANGTPEAGEFRLVRIGTGEVIDVEGVGAACVYAGRRVVQVVLRDITERKRTERYYRTLLEHVSDIVGVVDNDGVITYETPSVESATGFRPDEMVGRRAMDFVHPDDFAPLQAMFEAGLRSDGTAGCSGFRHLRKDGSWVLMEANAKSLLDGNTMVGAVITARDITPRVQALEAVKREQAFRTAIEESMRAGVLVIDSSRRIAYVNAGFCGTVGWTADELIGTEPPFAFWPTELALPRAAALQQLFEDGYAPGVIETTYVRRDGSRVDVLIAPSMLDTESGTQIVAVVYDVSERKRLEEQLRQSQKMEAVGRLAGGVAHDFNNLLTAILGYTELLLDEVPQTHPLRTDIEQIRRAGESAASLTRQLLAFSRRQILKPEILDINIVIGDLTRLLRRTIGEDVRLDTRLARDVGRVRADRGQLEQVLMNLSVNARDAMPKGGSLVIDTAPAFLDAPIRHGRWTIPPGRYVRLAFIDTGCGMTPDVLTHLFEPFFTTKARGKGTGLGLPTVYGIVSQSGGHVAVESTPTAGTIVFVYLPVTDARATMPTPSRPQSGTGSETILVAEDDPVIRSLARDVLSAHGYTVLAAPNGEEAEVLATKEKGRIDLLFTDVVMPGISGIALSRRLRATRPDLKCLYTSGYTDESLAHHGLESGRTAFLQKPFTPATLLHAIRSALTH